MNKPSIYTDYELKKIPLKFYRELSKLFYALGIDGNDFIQDFIYSYIDYSLKISNRNTDVYLSTGFGRRKLENHLKGLLKKQINIQKENHKTLIGQLESLSKKNPGSLIRIYGKHNSFNSAFQNLEYETPHITARSMREKLIRVGFIEPYDKRYVKFITNVPKKGQNDIDDIIKLLTNTLNTLCSTLLYNLKSKNQNDTRYQMTIFSDCISEKNYQQCLDELAALNRGHYKKCMEVLLNYEEKGDFQKRLAESNNIKLGTSAFIFLTKK